MVMVIMVMLTLTLILGLHGLTSLALSPFSLLALVSSCESSHFFLLLSVLFLVILKLFFFSWASGALDPESTTSSDLVTSVKRFPLSLFCMFFFLNLFIFLTLLCFFFLQGSMGYDCCLSCILSASGTFNVNLLYFFCNDDYLYSSVFFNKKLFAFFFNAGF